MALRGRIAYVKAMTQPHRPVGPGDHVFLIDGSSFVFRAYYQSIRQDQKYNYRMDRLPTGAIRLFATKVLQFIRDGAGGYKPTHLAMIFDKTENSFRRDIYPAIQGAPEGPARRTGAAISADARDRLGLRHGPDRAEPLRGRRHHRHLRAPGARRPAPTCSSSRPTRTSCSSSSRGCRCTTRLRAKPASPALARSGASASTRSRNISGSARTGWSTSRRSLAIRPTTCRARPASGSRPPLSSSPNMAISRRCSRARAKSNSPSVAKR